MHRHRSVTSRTISLENGAFEALRSAKLPGESYSKVIRRLLAEGQPPIRRLAGAWTARTADEVAAAIAAHRREQEALRASRDQVHGFT